jgi:hypothetical protein
MAASTSFSEFCQNVGYVPLRNVSSEAFAVIGAFFVIYLLLYGPFLVVAIPAHWLAVHVLGISSKVIAYAVGALCLVALFKERKAIFAQLEEIFELFKQMPEFFTSLFIVALVVGIASFVWLPLWLALGIFLSFGFLFAFLERMNDLGQKYTPPDADALITASLQDLELPRRTKDLFESTLMTLLRIICENGPPKYDIKTQASVITGAMSTLAADIEYRHQKAIC